jgi:RNase P subunit RPR2
MKTCKNCLALLPYSEFHRKIDTVDGLQRRCKKCNKQIVYGYRQQKYLDKSINNLM